MSFWGDLAEGEADREPDVEPDGLRGDAGLPDDVRARFAEELFTAESVLVSPTAVPSARRLFPADAESPVPGPSELAPGLPTRLRDLDTLR